MAKWYRKVIIAALVLFLTAGIWGCGAKEENAQVSVFAAASLSYAMEDIVEEFNKDNPNIKVVVNGDSSGKLQTQIQEGYDCDIFFSAGKKQMDALEEEGFLVPGTRVDLLNNTLVVITGKDSKTDVTGLSDLGKAESMALADGSVPAGRYTRVALKNLGILGDEKSSEEYTTKEVSNALGGVEISEQGNVSKVLIAVKEKSSQVGTTYYSDTKGNEDEIDILEFVDKDLTGNIVYPMARIENKSASNESKVAAEKFYEFLMSDTAKKIYKDYYFEVFK